MHHQIWISTTKHAIHGTIGVAAKLMHGRSSDKTSAKATLQDPSLSTTAQPTKRAQSTSCIRMLATTDYRVLLRRASMREDTGHQQDLQRPSKWRTLKTTLWQAGKGLTPRIASLPRLHHIAQRRRVPFWSGFKGTEPERALYRKTHQPWRQEKRKAATRTSPLMKMQLCGRADYARDDPPLQGATPLKTDATAPAH